jgi:hypothetical protein
VINISTNIYQQNEQPHLTLIIIEHVLPDCLASHDILFKLITLLERLRSSPVFSEV